MIGIRGATTVTENSEEAILEASKELILEIEKVNNINRDKVASMIFTCTNDLDKVAPSKAARYLGYLNTALLNFNEMYVENTLPMSIRVLIMYNSSKEQSEANHVYLRGTKTLRPDLF